MGPQTACGPPYDFQHLMARRVENIILASSVYDTFILEEAGRLNELLLSEFLDLNLHHTTGVRHVTSGAEALSLATCESRFNLIVTACTLADMDAAELAVRAKEAGLAVPVILLAFDGGELADFLAHRDTSALERIFLWQGDPRILLAITKYMEDKLNVAYDVGVAGVQVILLIEDNIRYYSSFLPLIYTEIIKHSQRLISEGVNLPHKILRMRARPKILLCTSFEEAWEYFSLYKEEVLGVISDVEFPVEGQLDPQAGTKLAQKVNEAYSDIPVLLQSSRPESEAQAREVNAAFLLKGSPTLLQDLRRFIVENFFFGDFIFRLPDGTPVGRARDLKTLLEMLRTVPAESIAYHAERNHFSRWLKARTEFRLAHLLRPRTAADYPTVEDRRGYLIEQIHNYRREQAQASVSDFDPTTFDPENSFARLSEGSLGGKARALAFARHLLHDAELEEEFPSLDILVPACAVLGTDTFDRFLDDNDLRQFALSSTADKEIEARFLAAHLPVEIEQRLASYLDLARYPLAVRSSSLLEDSQYQPLAGVYRTYMLPNNHPDPAVREEQLLRAIKRVYASTFLSSAKNYFKVTPYRLEEEKMAVIIQKLVGTAHGSRFYPSFAGVARSYNFYPVPPGRPEDGVVAVALGLGRTVVEGGLSYHFCPRYPRHPFQPATPAELLANSQREFVALELEANEAEVSEHRHPLSVAEADGTLGPLASTYDPGNDAVYDGLSRRGVRLVTFSPLLKDRSLPFPALLLRLLELGRWGMNTEVEIEFAVQLGASRGREEQAFGQRGDQEPRQRRGRPPSPAAKKAEFAFLQMRPLALGRESGEFELEQFAPEEVLVYSTSVLGNGRLSDLHDVVAVDYERFDRAQTREMAAQVARLNAELVEEGRRYLLLGLGRWGSADPWLGIPVTWEQISGARVIVESGLKDIKVTPSQGSHFFQNLTSFRVGYFTVNPEGGQGHVDWEWLAGQPARKAFSYVRHLRFDQPLLVSIDGRRQQGVILKPRKAEQRT